MADRYTKGQMLGKGSFGAAYLVTCKADGQKYVLKEIDVSRMQRAEREAAEQEAKVPFLSHSSLTRRLARCATYLQIISALDSAGPASLASSQRGQLQGSVRLCWQAVHPDGLLL